MENILRQCYSTSARIPHIHLCHHPRDKQSTCQSLKFQSDMRSPRNKDQTSNMEYFYNNNWQGNHKSSIKTNTNRRFMPQTHMANLGLNQRLRFQQPVTIFAITSIESRNKIKFCQIWYHEGEEKIRSTTNGKGCQSQILHLPSVALSSF